MKTTMSALAAVALVAATDVRAQESKVPEEIDWLVPERQTHAVVEFLAAFDDEDSDADRKVPKVVSPVDPSSAWTAKANKRVQFGYGLNYLIATRWHETMASGKPLLLTYEDGFKNSDSLTTRKCPAVVRPTHTKLTSSR